jgi:hypothetical protein
MLDLKIYTGANVQKLSPSDSRSRCILLLCIATFLGACAPLSSTPHASGAQQAVSGRYLHLIDASTSNVVFQMNLANAESCILVLGGVRQASREWLKTNLGPSASQADIERVATRTMFCADRDESKQLPFRATLRNVSVGILVDTYSVSLNHCRHSLGEPDSNIQVVSPCQRY